MDIIQRYVIPNTSTPLVLSAAQYAYYRFSSYGYNNSQALYDSLLTLVSLVTAKVFANAFVAKTVGNLDNYYATNMISYLTEPLVNYFLYGYLYRTQFKESQIGYSQKTDLNLILTPIIQSVISIFLDRTIIEWVTGQSGIHILLHQD